MKAARVAVAIAFALALQTILARYLVGSGSRVDLVLVAVVYVAMTTGPVTAILSGAIGGIVQDALSGGIIGVGGLAKTIVGVAVAMLSTQIIIVQPLPRFVVFVASTLVHAMVFLGLYSMLESRIPNSSTAGVLGQALGNGIAGIVVFELNKTLPLLRRRGGGSGHVKRRLDW
ncbi:MAG: rod shape-determining protein MreD [Vicinamibacterales bacterium]|nr:rod shape-determining protein MreD [Acidobacteriota bacterium]MDP7295088.1 rod shape-determining protein MreD [Vicinamibacterales bacterium]MDP7471246.1 rod shape-determining protein MreD [Vicinamibacterales bacterium]MDP7672988.1 rod shape-determining protein MreD [Vicinamibacterales bacterium]HJO38267.1 rod shape-determining protein MreD [Vicinamibacterales bacterium]